MKKVVVSSILAMSTLSTAVLADWNVDNEQSKVFFISTKNLNVSEIHHFKQVEGSVDQSGKFKIEIDLSSVETGIDIRNQRMKEMLFNVKTYPKATVSATLPKEVMNLDKGDSLQVQLPATLNIMGIDKALNVDVVITKTQDGDVIVTSREPLLISAADVGLKEGVEALQKIAGLSSISLSVPVSFSLVLN